MSFFLILDAAFKIFVLAVPLHFFYLMLVKVSLKDSEETRIPDWLGGIPAKLFNSWLDVVGGQGTDGQTKLILAIHFIPSLIITGLIWQYLIPSVIFISLIFGALLIFVSPRRRY